MKKLLLCLPLFFLLSACASVTGLNQSAKNVVVSQKSPARSCKKVIEITSTERGQFVSAPKLEKGAINQLRNNAQKKGANYVRIIKNFSSSKIGDALDSTTISAVTVVGDAYRCG